MVGGGRAWGAGGDGWGWRGGDSPLLIEGALRNLDPIPRAVGSHGKGFKWGDDVR